MDVVDQQQQQYGYDDQLDYEDGYNKYNTHQQDYAEYEQQQHQQQYEYDENNNEVSSDDIIDGSGSGVGDDGTQTSGSISSIGNSSEFSANGTVLTHRNKLVLEIVSTEKSYLRHLSDVINMYLEPLRNNRPAILEAEYATMIFSCIEKIRDLSEQIVNEMTEITESGSENVALPFLDKKDRFKELYITYGKNHGDALEVISKLLEKKPSFVQFIATVRETQKGNRLDLQSYLIMPIQRMPRYKLLLNELLEVTEKEHQDYQDIASSLNMIASVTKCVNEEIRKQENKLKVEKIQNSLVGAPSRIVSDARYFVREGQMMKVCRKVPKPRWFFLFSDALIYATTNSNTNPQNPNPAYAANTSSNTTYTFHRMMLLNDVKIKDLKDKDNQKNAFQIISSTEKSFTVYTETEKEKANWFEDFKLLSLKIIDENVSHDLEGSEVAVWVPDKEASRCMFCNDSFTIINRRHHCRNCGKVVCGDCSPGKILIPHVKKSKPVRVCLFCYDYIALGEKEKERSTSVSSGLGGGIPFSMVMNHHHTSHSAAAGSHSNPQISKTQTISKFGISMLDPNSKKRSNSTATMIPTSPDKQTYEDSGEFNGNGSPNHQGSFGGTLRRLKMAIKPSEQYKTMKKEKEKEKEKEKDKGNTQHDYNRTQSEPFLVHKAKGVPLPSMAQFPNTPGSSQSLPTKPSSSSSSSSSNNVNNNQNGKVSLPMINGKHGHSASMGSILVTPTPMAPTSSGKKERNSDIVLTPTPPAPTNRVSANSTNEDVPPPIPRRTSRAGSQPPLPNITQLNINNNNNNEQQSTHPTPPQPTQMKSPPFKPPAPPRKDSMSNLNLVYQKANNNNNIQEQTPTPVTLTSSPKIGLPPIPTTKKMAANPVIKQLPQPQQQQHPSASLQDQQPPLEKRNSGAGGQQGGHANQTMYEQSSTAPSSSSSSSDQVKRNSGNSVGPGQVDSTKKLLPKRSDGDQPLPTPPSTNRAPPPAATPKPNNDISNNIVDNSNNNNNITTNTTTTPTSNTPNRGRPLPQPVPSGRELPPTPQQPPKPTSTPAAVVQNQSRPLPKTPTQT